MDGVAHLVSREQCNSLPGRILVKFQVELTTEELRGDNCAYLKELDVAGSGYYRPRGQAGFIQYTGSVCIAEGILCGHMRKASGGRGKGW